MLQGRVFFDQKLATGPGPGPEATLTLVESIERQAYTTRQQFMSHGDKAVRVQSIETYLQT